MKKKIISFLLSSVLVFGLLPCSAFAVETSFDATLEITEKNNGNTIIVKINNFPNNLAAVLSIPCGEGWKEASVTKDTVDGNALENVTVFYDEESAANFVNFTVSEGGTYVILNATPQPEPEPAPEKPSSKPSSSGSGGGSNTVTETVKNPDGSTTTTKTDTVTGTVTETVKTESGVTGTTVTNAEGKITEVSAALPVDAAQKAAKAGETVTLPVEVPAAKESAEAVSVEVKVPVAAGSVKVEIPVENVTAGTVAVIVYPDGREEVCMQTGLTEDGITLNVEGTATVKIVENSKTFGDVSENDWEKKAVDFTSSRNLMNGMGGDTFAPDVTTTRAMIWTMLARLSGVDTSTGSTWDEVGRNWAIANGISDGTNSSGEVTREQLAVMLYRYMGSPDHEHNIEHFDDHNETSDWARAGKEWAVGNGILNGKSNNGVLKLDPQGDASRGEVAQMFMNFVITQM